VSQQGLSLQSKSKSVSVSVSKSNTMGLGHEKLDVYRLSIGYVAWVYEKPGSLTGVHRPARDQWLRASQSIPLNTAEGNGKTAHPDRRRYFETARGSALECAAIQDVLVVGKALNEIESLERKTELDRMAAMLSRLGGRGYNVREDPGTHQVGDFDPDSDPDPDSDFDSDFGGRGPQPDASHGRGTAGAAPGR